VQAVEHLFFSHLHMDHVGGFDAFFRATFDRTAPANHVWGPPRTAEILQHRFQGYLWNLVAGARVSWHVHDVHPGRVASWRFELGELFAVAHDASGRDWSTTILEERDYRVDALLMDHGTPSVAYIVREAARANVDLARLATLGLTPGPWMKALRDSAQPDETELTVGSRACRLGELRQAVLVVTPGASIAYLTDFLLDEAAQDRLAAALSGCGVVVCESQYRHADRELATRNRHMTAVQAATLARRAGAARLVLFHLSDRYQPEEWLQMLDEARAVFPNTEFPWRFSSESEPRV
jgi:ribonuclease Z